VRHCVVTGGEPLIFAHLPALLVRLRQLGMHITIETAGTVTLAGLGNGAPSPAATGAAARAEAPSPALVQLMSISPKLRNSTPWNDARDTDGTWAARHEARRLNIPALASLLRGPWESQLKFVVSHERDLAEIEELLAALDGVLDGVLGGALRSVRGGSPDESPASSLDRSRVLLMPEGTHQAPPGSHAWLAKACIERGFRYCHRVHIDLFGHVRGT
jgi:7-carboxy-7-deazaguanine synthase